MKKDLKNLIERRIEENLEIEDDAMRAKKMNETSTLIDKLLKEEEIQVNKSKNQDNFRNIVELVKAGAMVTIGIANLYIHRKDLYDILRYEETGSIRCKPGREFKILPLNWKL